jgi:hypothetical protein
MQDTSQNSQGNLYIPTKPNVCPGCNKCNVCGRPNETPSAPAYPYSNWTSPQPLIWWNDITCGGASGITSTTANPSSLANGGYSGMLAGVTGLVAGAGVTHEAMSDATGYVPLDGSKEYR